MVKKLCVILIYCLQCLGDILFVFKINVSYFIIFIISVQQVRIPGDTQTNRTALLHKDSTHGWG